MEKTSKPASSFLLISGQFSSRCVQTELPWRSLRHKFVPHVFLGSTLLTFRKMYITEQYLENIAFNPLKTKRRPSPYRAVNTFHLDYKNQSVYAVSGTSRCLFSDKYKTHKYSVGRAYSC